MKRHGGESDYKPVAREFSKKQQKRNKKLMIRRKEQVDQTKKKMEKIQTQKQAESPALEKYGENLQDM